MKVPVEQPPEQVVVPAVETVHLAQSGIRTEHATQDCKFAAGTKVPSVEQLVQFAT
jgi:hypothetical protein